MLYMLFFASCIHSLKKSQLETKHVGNKRQACNYKKSSFVLLTSLRQKNKKKDILVADRKKKGCN